MSKIDTGSPGALPPTITGEGCRFGIIKAIRWRDSLTSSIEVSGTTLRMTPQQARQLATDLESAADWAQGTPDSDGGDLD